MAAEQRKLLEQLMGDQFSSMNTSKTANLTLTSPGVCRSYLAGTCPHDLFTNTKQDIGICPKFHPENLKLEYDALAKAEKEKLGFDYDYMRDMQKYIDDLKRRRMKSDEQMRFSKRSVTLRKRSVRVCWKYRSLEKWVVSVWLPTNSSK